MNNKDLSPTEAETVRRQLSNTLKRELLKRQNNHCAFCGISSDVIPLQLARLAPFGFTDEDTVENYVLLCPNCHALFDNAPRDTEFIAFLFGLLEANTEFTNVQKEIVIGEKLRFEIDLMCVELTSRGKTTLLLECSTSGAITEPLIKSEIARLKRYAAIRPEARLVLAVPSTLMPKEQKLLSDSGIDLWDLSYIANRFAVQIEKANAGYFSKLFLGYQKKDANASEEDRLIRTLKQCKPGKQDWHVYQKSIGRILELLFTPTLSKPLSELSDHVRANRRDFILPNYSDEGFWSFMRTEYHADYIVVDAKNYSRKVKKVDVLQIANYLKPHGAGLFGMILSRVGGDQFGCEHTLREQWLTHRKLIFVLNDIDIEAMLIAKREGRAAEDIIKNKIQQFRLSV